MKKNKNVIVVIVLASIFVLLSVLFMFGGKISWKGMKKMIKASEMPEANAITEEITNGVTVKQDFKCDLDQISNLAVVFTKQYYLEDVDIAIELLDGSKTLAKKVVDVKDIDDQHRVFLDPTKSIDGVDNKELTLKIYPVTKSDTGLCLMMNDSAKASFTFDKKTIEGTICFYITNE